MNDAWSDDELVENLRHLVASVGGVQSKLAKVLRVSDSQISGALSGHRTPGRAIARALGRRQVRAYVPIVPLEDTHDATALLPTVVGPPAGPPGDPV